MGQLEILQALKNLRAMSNDWHRCNDIIKYMKSNKLLTSNSKNFYRQLLQMASFSLIECRGVGLFDHYKEFRGKKQDKR